MLKGSNNTGWYLVNSSGERVSPSFAEKDFAEDLVQRLVYALRSMGG